MPLLDYVCEECGITKEVLVKATLCTHLCSCGRPMKKQIGKSSFALKGDGWYKDGYK